jgi:hypothetical protein
VPGTNRPSSKFAGCEEDVMEIAMVDAEVAEEFAFDWKGLPQERQKRLVTGISVEHWEQVGMPDYDPCSLALTASNKLRQ